MVATQRGALAPYTPRISVEWDLDAPGRTWQVVDGSLVFVDISGFTALSERLARLGRIGAEELTAVLDTVFGAMLRAAYARGGSLLKFGGDALLLLFESPDHVLQATAAAVEMRAALRVSKEIQTSVGRVHLKMSVGVHTGPIDFFLVGDTHRELIVTGPTASATTDMEGSADAGEIVVSRAIADALPTGWVGDPKGAGLLLRKRVVH
ncbi:MAG: adenylate/guanylate cyclase domain-containing protein, partial [Acidimicrobiia bacterium]